MTRAVLYLTLTAFSVLTVLALWHHGWWGIVAPHFKSLAAGQVFADLVIALCLAIAWMWFDAKAHQRNPWPWLVMTLALGSIGPLVYLLTRPQVPVPR
jgi:RsiW-degrading membrane proteinase PrsW (M82 family)